MSNVYNVTVTTRWEVGTGQLEACYLGKNGLEPRGDVTAEISTSHFTSSSSAKNEEHHQESGVRNPGVQGPAPSNSDSWTNSELRIYIGKRASRLCKCLLSASYELSQYSRFIFNTALRESAQERAPPTLPRCLSSFSFVHHECRIDLISM